MNVRDTAVYAGTFLEELLEEKRLESCLLGWLELANQNEE